MNAVTTKTIALYNMLTQIDPEWTLESGWVMGMDHNRLMIHRPYCGSYIEVKDNMSVDYQFYCKESEWWPFFDKITEVNKMRF
jgi:hypothetical protein